MPDFDDLLVDQVVDSVLGGVPDVPYCVLHSSAFRHQHVEMFQILLELLLSQKFINLYFKFLMSEERHLDDLWHYSFLGFFSQN